MRNLINFYDYLRYSLIPYKLAEKLGINDRRHTNFAIEAIEQTFNGTVDFGKLKTAKKSNIEMENLGYPFHKIFCTPYNRCNVTCHVCYPSIKNVLLLVNS